MISHTGGKTRDCGSYCNVCRVRSVRFHGASCFICREQEKERRSMGMIVAVFLVATLFMMGFISAHGAWLKLNIGTVASIH